MRIALLVLCIALTGCTRFPELDNVVSAETAAADYPALVPLEPLLANSAPVVADPVATSRTLNARVNALRARAAALQRTTIVDSTTRSRLTDSRS